MASGDARSNVAGRIGAQGVPLGGDARGPGLLARRRPGPSRTIGRSTCPSADNVPYAPHQAAGISERAVSPQRRFPKTDVRCIPRFLMEAPPAARVCVVFLALDPGCRGTLGLSYESPSGKDAVPAAAIEPFRPTPPSPTIQRLHSHRPEQEEIDDIAAKGLQPRGVEMASPTRPAGGGRHRGPPAAGIAVPRTAAGSPRSGPGRGPPSRRRRYPADGDRDASTAPGVDCPEVGHADAPAEPWANEATAFTQRTIGDRPVRFEYDRERLDRYGRHLAWVWTGDRLLNSRTRPGGAGTGRSPLSDPHGLPAATGTGAGRAQQGRARNVVGTAAGGLAGPTARPPLWDGLPKLPEPRGGPAGRDCEDQAKEPEMNFAVLGSAPLALELSRELARSGEDRVVAPSDDPAEILACPEIDVLILATSDAERCRRRNGFRRRRRCSSFRTGAQELRVRLLARAARPGRPDGPDARLSRAVRLPAPQPGRRFALDRWDGSSRPASNASPLPVLPAATCCFPPRKRSGRSSRTSTPCGFSWANSTKSLPSRPGPAAGWRA